MTGAAFGVARLRSRSPVFCEGYSFRRYCIVARIRGMFFGLRFTDRLPMYEFRGRCSTLEVFHASCFHFKKNSFRVSWS